MEKISSKCDCCGSFGYEDEFEVVTIKIKKHPACQIDQLFGKNNVQPRPGHQANPSIDLPRIDEPIIKTDATPVPSYMESEMAKIRAVTQEHIK